ncbi:MAG: hypothetical protein EBU81_16040, partial [Proteobacteria bacterium]|nr:hypothetical protein [Pseudomonadota bacterium]
MPAGCETGPFPYSMHRFHRPLPLSGLLSLVSLMATFIAGGPALGQVVSSEARQATAPSVPLSLGRDDTLVFHGNSLVERLLEHGELQGWIHLADTNRPV